MYPEALNIKCLCLVVFLQLTNGMSTEKSQINCRQNECMSIRECEPYTDFIGTLQKPLKANVIEFLRAQQCGFDEGYPKVCCTYFSRNLPTTKPPPRLTYPSCREKSECMPINDCRPYMNLIETLEKPLKPSVVNFLKTQECGFQDGYPKVCCSLLPKSLGILKHARPDSRPQINKLPSTSTLDDRREIIDSMASTDLVLNQIFGRTTTVRPLRTVSAGDRKIKEKMKTINSAFDMSDFFDFAELFDLRRRRRFDENNDIDIEIR